MIKTIRTLSILALLFTSFGLFLQSCCEPTLPEYVNFQFVDFDTRENLFDNDTYDSESLEIIRLNNSDNVDFQFNNEPAAKGSYIMIFEDKLGSHSYKITASPDLEVIVSIEVSESDSKKCNYFELGEVFVLDYDYELEDQNYQLYNILIN